MAFRPAKDGSEPAPKKTGATERAAPWRGRPKVADQKARKASIRYTAAEYATVEEAARQGGLSFGAHVRKVTAGAAGPRARHQKTEQRIEMAKALPIGARSAATSTNWRARQTCTGKALTRSTFQTILRA